MPLQRVKPRIRYFGAARQVKRGGDPEAQRKPTGTVSGGAQVSMSNDGQFTIDVESIFAKKRVPSIDELGDLLRSTLSSDIAAAKAFEAKQEVSELHSSPKCERTERLEENDGDSLASLIEPPHLYTRIQATDEEVPTEPFLTTTTIYRPLSDDVQPASSRSGQVEHAIDDQRPSTTSMVEGKVLTLRNNEPKPTKADVVLNAPGVDSEEPPASLLATADIVVAPSNYPELVQRTSQIEATPAASCACEGDGGVSISALAESPQSFEHTRPAPARSSTALIEPRKLRWSFLQRVVTLFAGRRRCYAVEEEQADTDTPHQEPPEASAPSIQRSRLPRRQTTIQIGGSTPPKPIRPKNLPLSPPIMAPRRPYRPIDERPNAYFIPPAREHRYTGTYYVAPDIFTPTEVQLGFPSVERRTKPTSPIGRTNPDSELLDRDDTLWAKWYAKAPTAEHMPFAKACQKTGETTDQQLWDAHVARHARMRRVRPPLGTDEDVSRQLDNAEHERAARLRYHSGHCFGALMGNVYPFNGGYIF